MRVVIADDETLLREGLARLLTDTGFEVVGKAGTADELLRRVELTRPDLAIVDIKMPPTRCWRPRPLPLRRVPLRDAPARGAPRGLGLPA